MGSINYLFRHAILAMVLIAGAFESVGFANGELIITEVMYNCSSLKQWVELYNSGPDDVTLADWVLDVDNATRGDLKATNVAPATVGAREYAILYNGLLSSADFSNAWGTGLNLIAVNPWPSMTRNNTIGLWSSWDVYYGDVLVQNRTTLKLNISSFKLRPSSGRSIYMANESAWGISDLGDSQPYGGVAYSTKKYSSDSTTYVGSPGVYATVALATTTSDYQEGGTNVYFMITRNGGPTDLPYSTSVTWALSGGSENESVLPTDFSGIPSLPITGVATFGPSETTTLVTVPLLDDITTEPKKFFTITLKAAKGALIDPEASKLLGSLLDDDENESPYPSVQTSSPSDSPIAPPSPAPTKVTPMPTVFPSVTASDEPSSTPMTTTFPSDLPTIAVTASPSISKVVPPETVHPSPAPSTTYTEQPSAPPSPQPSRYPTLSPSTSPTHGPTAVPSKTPSYEQSLDAPTPTAIPTTVPGPIALGSPTPDAGSTTEETNGGQSDSPSSAVVNKTDTPTSDRPGPLTIAASTWENSSATTIRITIASSIHIRIALTTLLCLFLW